VLLDKVKQMERVVESEPEATEAEIEVKVEFEEEDEEIEFIVPWEDEVMDERSSGNKRLYGMTFGGLSAIIALLLVPLVTLPGMVILVLFAEIYLVDWTYSKISLLRNAKSGSSHKLKGGQGQAGILDRKNPRANPKDQFVK
jgi:hypothetical protein